MKGLTMFKNMMVSIALTLVSGSLLANEVAIAIHGGAGTITRANLSDEKAAEIIATLEEAVTAGHKALKDGEPSVKAIQKAIIILEDSPLFNAGRGAVFNYAGGHDLDASIMDGSTLQAGAIAGVSNIKNPILLAFDVMTQSKHVMLSGKGAENFAQSLGYEFVPQTYFATEFRRSAWERAMSKQQKDTQARLVDLDIDYKFGTVGAVALDKNGNLAAGTSTGGMTAKRWGRIGDSPVIGAGTYANNDSCAVSATGHGEFFIRYNVAADICARMEYGNKPLKQAANEVIFDELLPAKGMGGVIAIDNKGNVAMPFNTEGMYRASVDTKGTVTVAIYGL